MTDYSKYQIDGIYQSYLEWEDVKTCKNAKEIFNQINSRIGGGYSEVAFFIFDFLKDNSQTFVKDIAERAAMDSEISYKQCWCCAYEFVKIN